MIGGISMGKVYTIPKQNYVETITQHFGRFFHSPLYFDTQLPYMGTINFQALASAGYSIIEENVDYSEGTSISTKSDGTSRYFCIEPEVGDILRMYSPYISPAVLYSDSTLYRMVPCVVDSSILVRIYYNTGSSFDTWNIDLGKHPFTVTEDFYLSFYGKRN